MVITSPDMLVWEEDEEESLILTSVQEMIVRVSGGRPQNLVLVSAEWPAIKTLYVLHPVSLLMKQATRRCVGELEAIKRVQVRCFMVLLIIEQLTKTMHLDYQSLTVVILVSTFGLMLESW